MPLGKVSVKLTLVIDSGPGFVMVNVRVEVSLELIIFGKKDLVREAFTMLA